MVRVHRLPQTRCVKLTRLLYPIRRQRRLPARRFAGQHLCRAKRFRPWRSTPFRRPRDKCLRCPDYKRRVAFLRRLVVWSTEVLWLPECLRGARTRQSIPLHRNCVRRGWDGRCVASGLPRPEPLGSFRCRGPPLHLRLAGQWLDEVLWHWRRRKRGSRNWRRGFGARRRHRKNW